jgi:ParB family transcriptional regulator, chromosome partitioning protein
MDKKTGLGKGLSALFSENKVDMNNISGKEIQQQDKKNFFEIEIISINLNPHQPREDFNEEDLQELADSIKKKGLLQPITVKRSVHEKDRYDLISGERRLKALIKLNYTAVPAYIYETDDHTAENMLELALIENIQRQDLNPMELATSYQKLISECGLTQEEVAVKVSKQRSSIGNTLRLLKLPDEIKASLRKNEINEGHARMILRYESAEDQIKLWEAIKKENYSVRKLEEITKKTVKKKKKKDNKLNEFENSYYQNIEDKLTRFFGTKVKVKKKNNSSGEIIIEYYSEDDIDRILEKCGD